MSNFCITTGFYRVAILLRNKTFYFVKRVPKEFQRYDKRGIVQVSLKTDSEKEAREKAVQVETALQDQWIAQSLGLGNIERYKALVKIAASRNLRYKPLAEIYERGGIAEVIARADSLSDDDIKKPCSR